MNKLSKEEYILHFAKSLCDTYGSTLLENGLDLEMAKDLVNNFSHYLIFSESISKKKLKEMRNKHVREILGDSDYDGYGVKYSRFLEIIEL